MRVCPIGVVLSKIPIVCCREGFIFRGTLEPRTNDTDRPTRHVLKTNKLQEGQGVRNPPKLIHQRQDSLRPVRLWARGGRAGRTLARLSATAWNKPKCSTGRNRSC